MMAGTRRAVSGAVASSTGWGGMHSASEPLSRRELSGPSRSRSGRSSGMGSGHFLQGRGTSTHADEGGLTGGMPRFVGQPGHDLSQGHVNDASA